MDAEIFKMSNNACCETLLKSIGIFPTKTTSKNSYLLLFKGCKKISNIIKLKKLW